MSVNALGYRLPSNYRREKRVKIDKLKMTIVKLCDEIM